MGDDDLNLLHAAILAGLAADVAGFAVAAVGSGWLAGLGHRRFAPFWIGDTLSVLASTLVAADR
ncbi:hypothetical protein BU204_19900 [Actinophytocola xanthii]|uniref:Uncharacterized protein n=1 Tax=Actinophytocola xanthii TaxID=1912961 RepID=A0A1Q8CNB7_9PSEU|nr:hypothetical protein BU204_19900 [Actinophytocola xanthii]